MINRFFLSVFAILVCATLLAAPTKPRAADSLLDDIGLSEETTWQINQPTRESVESANKVRGSYLRTEVRRKQSNWQLVVGLALVEETGQPTFRLAVQEEQVINEVRVYETLLRSVAGNEGGARGAADYRVLPGEFTYGEETFRTEKLPEIPLSKATVKINAIEYQTDEQGIVLDPQLQLRILDSLDTLDKRTMDFLIEAPEMPARTYTVFRTMPQRRDFDEKILDEPGQQDILLCYHLNFRQSLLQPEQEGLEVSLDTDKLPAIVRTGEYFPVTVKVANRGSRQSSCLLARSFSRLNGLNGKLFYFGAIPPGDEARFTRYVKVSPEELVNQLFLEIRFSDSWGVLKQSIPLQLPLIH